MDVLEYFRLDEEPFRLSPSPRFLYLNDQVKQATAKVEYMTKHRTAHRRELKQIGKKEEEREDISFLW